MISGKENQRKYQSSKKQSTRDQLGTLNLQSFVVSEDASDSFVGNEQIRKSLV